MSRFYVPPRNIGEDRIMIEGEEAHHAIDVMRLKEGDSVVIFDGTGREFSCSVSGIDAKAKTLTAKIISASNYVGSSASFEITLAQALPKKSKMDYIVEKATELGVSRIIPVVTERTIVRPDEDGAGKKTARWKKIAIEAAKQCRRVSVPEIEDVMLFKDIASLAGSHDLCLLACLTDKTVPLKEPLASFRSGRIFVMIGPEGDFTPTEISFMEKIKNCRLVSLGERVLKSDTAGLFVLSAINYELSK